MGKRKNKGYQREYDRRGRKLCFPEGDNKSLEQVELSCDNNTLQRINLAKNSYKEIAKHPELTGKALKDYCREWMLWEVKFDDNFNVIPLETVIEQIKNDCRHYKSSRIYGARRFTGYMRRITNKDNQKFVYNGTGNCVYRGKARIPSLKRSKATWTRFYELFPYYREHFNELTSEGIKLRKVW